MQLAMGATDAAQVPTGDNATQEDKSRAMLIAALGAAEPAITAGVLLLMYKLAMALFIGLGPIFIMCLIFDQAKIVGWLCLRNLTFSSIRPDRVGGALRAIQFAVCLVR
jgi:hypothetical protein